MKENSNSFKHLKEKITYYKQYPTYIKLCYLCIFVIPIILLISIINLHPYEDGLVYVQMGDGFSKYGEFFIPQYTTYLDSNILIYSHNYPPIFPLYLGTFYHFFGYSQEATQIAIYMLYIIFVFVIYYTSKDFLNDRKKALFVTALIGLNPYFIYYSARAYSEIMVMIFFTLTVWTVIKGLKNDKYFFFAGIFAGFGFLSKSSVGYFFIIAGIGGFIWRFYYMKWNVFRNKYYLGAIAIFTPFIAVWSYRNILRFGWPNWETSGYVQDGISYSFNHIFLFIPYFFIKLIFLILLLFCFGIYLAPELFTSIKNWKEEENSGLWFATIGITILLGAIFCSMFFLIENTPLFWIDNMRYILIALLPLIWLGMKYITLDDNQSKIKNHKQKMIKFTKKKTVMIIFSSITATFFFFSGLEILAGVLIIGLITLIIFFNSPKKRLSIYIIVILVLAIYYGTITVPHCSDMTNTLRNNIKDGDSITWAVSSEPLYDITLLSIDHKIIITTIYDINVNTTYIIKTNQTSINLHNYTLLGSYKEDVSYKYGFISMFSSLFKKSDNTNYYYLYKKYSD